MATHEEKAAVRKEIADKIAKLPAEKRRDSLAKIAKQYNYNPMYVRTIAKDAELLPPRVKGEPVDRTKHDDIRKRNNEIVTAIAKEDIDKRRKKATELAKHHGIGVEYIIRLCRSMSVQFSRNKAKANDSIEKTLTILGDYVKNRDGVAAVANRHNVSTAHVGWIVKMAKDKGVL